MIVIYIFKFFIFILCILLMRRVLIHEITIFDLNDTISELNEKLNLSDKEYIDLFTENMKISEELSSFRVLERIKNL